MVMDRQSVISSLVDWNIWWVNGTIPDALLGRKRDLLIPMDEILDRKEIKTVSGVRRCGKSTLIYQVIMNELKKGIAGKNILMINFDDNVLSTMDLNSLIDIYKEELGPEGRIHLFLDEVHNCPDWVGTIRKMYDLSRLGQVFITDSSSKYISGEYTTLISGRTIDIRLHPISFREFVIWMDLGDPDGPFGQDERATIKRYLGAYLKWGGFPEVALAKSDIQRKILLTEYMNTIIYKDIVERYRANPERLKILVGYLLSTPGALFSPRNFSRRHGFSMETIDNYIGYMKEVNFIHVVPKFDHSYNKVLRSTKKIYIEDTGLTETLGLNFMEKKGMLLENAVFNEINRLGFEIYYWADGKSECDFILKKGREILAAIQVCHELNEDDIQRELDGIGNACRKLSPGKGLMITSNISGLDTGEYEKVPLWRFLLDPKRYLDK